MTILEAPDAKELEGRTFFCPTADVSISGVRLSLHRDIPAGSQIELRIAFKEPLRAFRHRGRVVWSQEVGQKHPHAVGIEFFDRGATDGEWIAFMKGKDAPGRG